MGFKILYYSVYISLFLNYSVHIYVYTVVCVCVCTAVCSLVHVSLCWTIIVLDRLGKVTSLPDCVDFPQRSNEWAGLNAAACGERRDGRDKYRLGAAATITSSVVNVPGSHAVDDGGGGAHLAALK